MAPTNSRPPLTSRIRASFDGKRRKSDASNHKPINSFATYDPEALQDAIEKAISGDAFQDAIAKHLAKLIEPSIKSALDTIQPVVETVYKHQVLLRKTNRSVENILQRLDTGPDGESRGPEPDTEGQELEREVPISRDSEGYFSNPSATGDSTPTPRNARHTALEAPNTETAKMLSDLSNLVDTNNGKIEEGFTGVHAALLPTTEGIGFLKSSSEQSHTNIAVIQAQLDQLTSDVGLIIDAIRSDLGVTVREMHAKINTQDNSLLSSHARKLDAISDHLDHLKGESGSELLQEISENIGALKETVEAGIVSSNDNFNTLGSHFSNVLSSMETHSGALTGLKQADNSAEILAAIQKSNDSHASHATILSEIKDRRIGLGSGAAPTLENNAETTAALQALSSDLAALKENIEAGLTSNGDGLTGLGVKIEGALAAIESHWAADSSAEILAAVQKSNDSHASHATALEGIRSLNIEPAATGTSDISGLESKIGDIIQTLQSHSLVLDEIKTKAPPDLGVAPTETLETHVKTIIETLDAHSNMLTEIREADVSDEILTALHECNEYQSKHLAALDDMKEADVSDEILTALHTSNESHENHTVALAAIHDAVKTSNDSHAAHAGALDEIKATCSLEPSAPAETGNLGALETHITTIVANLEGHSSTLSEIKNATAASNDSHAAHSAALTEIKDIATTSNNFHASHSAALADLKANQPSDVPKESSSDFDNDNLATIETQINTIITTLETQNTTLADIKEATGNSNVLTAIEQSHELLTSHSSLLNSIKDENSYEDILANISSLKSIIEESKADISTHGTLVKDLHEETKSSHEGLTTAITALGAGLDAEALASKHDSEPDNTLLEEVKAVRTIVEKSSTSIETMRESVTSMTAQIDINHTTMTTSICTLGDELKAEIDASSTEMTNSIVGLSEDVKGVDLKPLNTAVESVVKGVTVLVGGVDILNEHVNTTGAYVTNLVDGVHLNEKGLGQLKEHSVASHIAPNPVQSKLIPEPITAKEVEPEPVPEPVTELEISVGEPEPTPAPIAKFEVPEEVPEPEQDVSKEVAEPSPTEPEEYAEESKPVDEEQAQPALTSLKEAESEPSPEPYAEPEIPTEELEHEHEPEASNEVEEPTPVEPEELVLEEKPVKEEQEQEPAPALAPSSPKEAEPSEAPIEPEPEQETPKEVTEAEPEKLAEESKPVEQEQQSALPSPEAAEPESTPEPVAEPEILVEESEPEPENSKEVEEPTPAEREELVPEEKPVEEEREQEQEQEQELAPSSPKEAESLKAPIEPEPEQEIPKEVTEAELEEASKEEKPVAEEQEQEPAPPSPKEVEPLQTSIEPESLEKGKEASAEEPPTHIPTPISLPSEPEEDEPLSSEPASTIASPLSPTFSNEGSGSGKKGKKGKKEKREKAGKKSKKEKFTFEPEDEEENKEGGEEKE